MPSHTCPLCVPACPSVKGLKPLKPTRAQTPLPKAHSFPPRRSRPLVWCLTRELLQQTSPVCPSTSPSNSSNNSSSNSNNNNNNNSSSNSNSRPYKRATTNCYNCSNNPTWCQLHGIVNCRWKCPTPGPAQVPVIPHADRDPASTETAVVQDERFGPQRPGLNTYGGDISRRTQSLPTWRQCRARATCRSF